MTHYIETLSESKLQMLLPIMAELAKPQYIVETDVTPEEIAMVDERMKDYEKDPCSWISAQDLLNSIL